MLGNPARDVEQVLFGKADGGNHHFPRFIYQENRGHIRQTKLIRNGVALLIHKNGESEAVVARESLGLAGIVLGNTPGLDPLCPGGPKQALDKRKGVLAYRTTRLEKGGKHHAILASRCQRIRLAIRRRKRKIRRQSSR